MIYNAFNDSELVYMARTGDVKAVALLEIKYKPIIKAWIKEILVRYHTFSNDLPALLQKELLTLRKSLICYRYEKGIFYSYVKVIIRNDILEYNRKQKTTNQVAFLSLNEKISAGGEEEFVTCLESRDLVSSPERLYVLQEGYNYLLGQPFFRQGDLQVLQLTYQGYSQKEIANLLNITPKQVENILGRIKRNIVKQKGVS